MNRRGFTIVELIITITIMGILMTVGVISFNGTQVKARDSERKSDISAIQSNLENYYDSGSDKQSTCMDGFILVPGSSTYGTSDFCVMKYEAKQSSSTVPISTASGTPWTYITQTNAIAYSQNVAGCTGCHLITEAEWMTIAQNVINVTSNWSTGTVGSGYIYSGHNDSLPAIALPASSDDQNGYYGEYSTGGNQRRTLTLNNGEVIWDMAGNVYEMTNDTIAGGLQPGLSTDSTYGSKEWSDASLLMNGLPATSQPSSTGITGISSLNSNNGIGRLWSYYGETSTRVIIRSFAYNNNISAGVLGMYLGYGTTSSGGSVGFRVAYPASSSQSLVVSENGRYPSTYINTSLDTMTAILTELDTKAVTAPNVDDAASTFKAATDNTQSTSSVTPQPTVDQYVYQPLTSSGTLCTSEAQICTKYNLYYRLEEDNTVYMVTSKNQ